MSDIMNDIVFDAHKTGLKKAMSSALEMDAVKIITYVVDYCTGKKELKDITKELSADYAPAVKKYLETFTDQALKNALKESENEKIQDLAKGDFAKQVRTMTLKVAKDVKKYFDGEIDEGELVNSIIHSGIAKVGAQFVNAYGIDLRDFVNKDGAFMEFSPETIGYICMTKVYEELMKALENADIAYERRVRIEAEKEKSIAMIRKYRIEMDAFISKYFTEHLETIGAGLKAMDEAIIEEDANGYIRGNVEIQKLLGRDIQFTNQNEFDDLMDSDLSLKL